MSALTWDSFEHPQVKVTTRGGVESFSIDVTPYAARFETPAPSRPAPTHQAQQATQPTPDR